MKSVDSRVVRRCLPGWWFGAACACLILAPQPPARAASPPPAAPGRGPTAGHNPHIPAPAAHAAPAANLREDFRQHAEKLWEAGRADDCLAYLDSVVAAGAARRDPAMILSGRLWRARILVLAGQDSVAGALLDSLAGETRAPQFAAARAWILDCRTSLTVSNADIAGSQVKWRSVQRAARSARVAFLEGKAHRMCASNFIMWGRYAEALPELREAKRLLPPDSKQAMFLPLIRGQAWQGLRRSDLARAAYLEGGRRCQAAGRLDLLRMYYNDLAVLEYDENDPAAALPWLDQALAIPGTPMDQVRTLEFELNRAWTVYQVGPPERGLALLRPLEAACDSMREPSLVTLVHAYLSEAYTARGEFEPALRHARRALESARQSSVESQLIASNAMASCQVAAGRLAEALATLDSMRLDHPEQKRAADLLGNEVLRIHVLLALGRLGEAEAAARAADRLARPDGPLKGAQWQPVGALLARIHRERGRPDSALVLLGRLRADWERRRASVTRDELREDRSSAAGELFAELGLALLDAQRRVPERLRNRAAFDALQPYQARTLEERMRGAGASSLARAHPIGADSLQRGVLRSGELLIDFVATPDTTLAFALTRDALVVRGLPGLNQLEPRVQRLIGVMESAHDGAGPAAALRWMADRVLAPFGELVASHAHIVITGGGALALLPWAALPDAGGRPLVAAHDVVVAPSATLWARARVHPRASAATAGMLVLGRTTDPAGRELPGVRQECRAVEAYAGVTSRVHDGRLPVAQLVRDLGAYRSIHLAAHMFSDNVNPWRSGVLLGRGSGDDAYLRASDVAHRTVAARLVVLSGCQSAATRSLPGEGPQGLANAFLCAGAPTVVASLWEVRDQFAAEFMTRFYAGLARGASAGAALRGAQAELREAGGGPGDWAAFVLWGSGDTSLPLQAARGAPWISAVKRLH